MVIAVGGQSVTDREPCDALIVVAVDDVHARQIIADDGLPFLIGQYALAGLDGERAVPHALPAMLAFGIVLASHVGRERIVLAFPDAVASVEPAAYPRIRRRRPAIHVKREKHVAARAPGTAAHGVYERYASFAGTATSIELSEADKEL